MVVSSGWESDGSGRSELRRPSTSARIGIASNQNRHQRSPTPLVPSTPTGRAVLSPIATLPVPDVTFWDVHAIGRPWYANAIRRGWGGALRTCAWRDAHGWLRIDEASTTSTSAVFEACGSLLGLLYITSAPSHLTYLSPSFYHTFALQ